MEDSPNNFETWGLVELFGHSRIAGRLTEQSIGGGAFLRVDVPAISNQPAFTRFFGAGAIYSITPTDEATATAIAAGIRVRPVDTYILPQTIRDSGSNFSTVGDGGDFENPTDDSDNPF